MTNAHSTDTSVWDGIDGDSGDITEQAAKCNTIRQNIRNKWQMIKTECSVSIGIEQKSAMLYHFNGCDAYVHYIRMVVDEIYRQSD